MIFLIPWVFVLIYAFRLGVLFKKAFLFNVFIAFAVLVFAFFELEILADGNLFYNPDEFLFAEESNQSLSNIIARHNRYLGFIVFGHFTIATLGEWALKFQSMPFGLLTSLFLYDVTGKLKSLWLFPLVFVYFFFITTFNLRDSIIIFFMLYFSDKIANSGFWGVFRWCLAAIGVFSFLRPEFAFVWTLISLWLLITWKIRNRVWLVFFLPVIIVFLVFIFYESEIVYLADFIYPERVAGYLETRAPELGNLPWLNSNASAIVRQIITPIPSSKIYQLLMVGPERNLVLKEIFRVVLMLAFYGMTFMLILRSRLSFQCIKQSRFLLVLFLVAAINTLLYAVYGDGGGSTRNKVYPYLFAYVVFFRVYLAKYERMMKVA